MKYRNPILAGLLAVQIVLIAIVFWPRSAPAATGEPVFPGLEVGDVVGLTIAGSDGDDLVLRRVDGEWVMPDADGYPAREQAITSAVEKLIGLTTGRMVTRTSGSHRRLGVAGDDFVARVTLETAGGAEQTLYLGTSPSYGTVHFRVAGEDEVYLTDELGNWEANTAASAWIDTAYLSVDRSAVTELTLENEHGTFTFVRNEEDEWVLEGLEEDEEPATGTINAVVSRATSVTMIRPLGTEEDKAYGLDEPAVSVTMETEDGTVTLLVGARASEEDDYVAKASDSPYYVLVSPYSVEPLVENGRDDFVAPPPTEAPATPES